MNDDGGDTCEEAVGSEIGDTPQSVRIVQSGVPLLDLAGTTAARSRKMDPEEREIMLMKRRLRNRASAARSRQKQRNQVRSLTEKVTNLNAKLKAAVRENERLAAEVAALRHAPQMPHAPFGH